MFAFLDMIIVRPIVNILFVIYSLVGDFGLAIILFTIIVKLITWPLMKRQLHQTRIMRQIQPELAEIKKNCKGNRQLESLQMMDLYKRKNVKPFRSMLTLLIQFPIFIGLFYRNQCCRTPACNR
jgi:YidC/Oxa1 family membrane protein insertase